LGLKLMSVEVVMWLYGDLGIFPWGRPDKEIVRWRETKDTSWTPLSNSISWLECSHNELWVL